jgi:hypothetical protein
MRNNLFAFASVLALVTAPAVSTAQETGVRTALSLVPGAVFNTADAGPSVGGAVTFDLSPWLALEGIGSYVDRGSGANALTIRGGVLANLLNGDRRAVPFVTAGAGLYRASFDLAAQRFFGGAGPFGPGASVCGGTGACPYGNLPAFYARRLGAVVAPSQGSAWPTRTFTDPAFHLGVGARLHLTSHVFVRPEFSGLFIAANRDVQSLGMTSVAFGYRF